MVNANIAMIPVPYILATHKGPDHVVARNGTGKERLRLVVVLEGPCGNRNVANHVVTRPI